MKVLKVLS